MTPELVIDASVALKWIVDEPDSPQALDVLERHLSDAVTFVAPSHLLGEVGNGLRKLVARGHLDPGEAVEALFDLIDLELEFVDATALWPRTLRSALDWQVTTYDAVYVLTALQRHTELLTADVRLQRSCREQGLPVRLLGA